MHVLLSKIEVTIQYYIKQNAQMQMFLIALFHCQIKEYIEQQMSSLLYFC